LQFNARLERPMRSRRNRHQLQPLLISFLPLIDATLHEYLLTVYPLGLYPRR
jgi:hypothetical protein